MMQHTVERHTKFGRVEATWHREGRMIVVRYGDRVQEAQASESDATNSFVAGNILDRWIAEDLSDQD
jgi:hypothetical protein